MDRAIGDSEPFQVDGDIMPGLVGGKDWFDSHKNHLQQVLSDTIYDALEVDYEIFGSRAFQVLPDLNWIAREYHKIEDLPSLNVLFVKNDVKAQEIIDGVTEKMRRIMKLLGYSKNGLSPLAVYIDPRINDFKGASAFMNLAVHNLWISSQKAMDLDHELVHWATSFSGDMRSMLLKEGIANWAAWQVKTDEEKQQASDGDYRRISRAAWPLLLKRAELTLDGDYDGLPVLARNVGGVLFDLICEALGNDTQKIGQVWKASSAYSKPSEWLREIELDPDSIEEKWRDRIFGEQTGGE